MAELAARLLYPRTITGVISDTQHGSRTNPTAHRWHDIAPMLNTTVTTIGKATPVDVTLNVGHDGASALVNTFRIASHVHSSLAGRGGQIQHTDLLGIGANDHHTESHAQSTHTGIITDDQHGQRTVFSAHRWNDMTSMPDNSATGIGKSSPVGVTLNVGHNGTDPTVNTFRIASHAHSGVGGSGGQIQHTNLISVSADDHHNQNHSITGLNHTGFPGGTTDFLRADGTFATPTAAHASVTLAASADSLLGLTAQEISLDTQTANFVLVGPPSGIPAVPVFRALLNADIPGAVLIDGSRALTADWATGSFDIDHPAATTGKGVSTTSGDLLLKPVSHTRSFGNILPSSSTGADLDSIWDLGASGNRWDQLWVRESLINKILLQAGAAPTVNGEIGLVTNDVDIFSGGVLRNATNIGGPAARVRRGDVSIPNGALTTLLFDIEDFDTDNIHSTVTNTERLTCRTAGKYLIMAQVEWAVSALGTFRQIKVSHTRSGIEDDIIIHGQAPSAIILNQHVVAALYDLLVNDFLLLRVQQDSGVSLNIVGSATWTPIFSMVRVGA